MTGIVISPVSLSSGVGGATGKPAPGFGNILADAITKINQTQAQANQAVASAMGGHGSVTQVMVAMTQAQMTLDIGIATRNGVAQAYQTIMNMPLS